MHLDLEYFLANATDPAGDPGMILGGSADCGSLVASLDEKPGHCMCRRRLYLSCIALVQMRYLLLSMI